MKKAKIKSTLLFLFFFSCLHFNFAEKLNNVICVPGFTWTINEECGFVAFQNTSTSEIGPSFENNWTFGDPAGSTSNEANPQFSYPAPGVYLVCLDISNLVCIGEICHEVEVGSMNMGNPPSVICPIINESLFCDPNFTLLPPIITNDPCAEELITNIPDGYFGPYSCGENSFTVTAENEFGIGFCTVTFQYLPESPLTLTCPANFTLKCISEYNPNNATPPIVTGGCSPGEPEFSDEFLSEDSCDGTIIRTWQVSDDCGGFATCQQIILIQDDITPIFTGCPADITVDGMIDDEGECSALVQLNVPTATDNCGNVTITNDYNGQLDASGVFYPDMTTITWTAVDDCGNEDQCSTVVTVLPCPQDTLCGKPVVTCYSGIGGGIVAAIKNTGDLSTLPYDVNSPFPVENSWTVNELGEVFGIAIDASNNIYFTSTTLYGPNSFGVNGVNIYKIDGTSLTFDPSFTVTLPNVSGPTRNTSNHAPGLGNIAYDEFNDQLLVTNHEDGRIYRINPMTGAVLGSIRPIGVDDGLPGFCPLGERLWGIQVRGTNASNVEVYYGVWRNDRLAMNGLQNWVGSVSLDATGDFIASTIDNDRIIIPFLSNYSNPVSDIAFSDDGTTMLLAERTMSGDMKDLNDFAHLWAHQGRMLRYEWNGSSWLPSSQSIEIGEQPHPNSSAGGVDFGYNYPQLESCEAMIYGTGDYLEFVTSYIYGLQVFDKTFPAVSTANSYLFDFDGNTFGGSKSLLGEVEVFKCTECFPPVCEDISATNTQTSTNPDCCYDMSFTNTGGYNITKANIIVNTPDWVISQGAINPSWTYGITGSQSVEIITNGGVPTSPIFAFDYCLSATSATASTTQEIIIEFFETVDDTLLLCRDTIYTECIPDFPPLESCVSITDPTIICSPDDPHIYCLSFDVTNISNPGFDAWQVVLSNLPPGFGFYDCNVSTPSYNDPINLQPIPLPLSSGNTATNMCVKLISTNDILAPTTIFFNVGLEGLDSCCTNPVPVEVELVPCCDPCEDISVNVDDAVFGDDSMEECCYDIDLINECEYNYFTKVKFDILTPGVVFSSHFNNDPLNWQVLGAGLQDVTLVPIQPFVPQGTYNDFFTFCLGDINDPSEIPQQVKISYFTLDQNGQDSIACDTILQFQCEPIDRSCAFITDPIITCDTINQKYILTVTVDNNSVPSFKATDLNIISTQPGVTITPNPIPLGCLGPNDPPVTITTCIDTNPWEDPDGLLPIVWRLKTANGDSCCNGGQIFYDTLTLPPCYETPSACCDDFDEFCDLVDLGWQVSQNECEVTVSSMQFDTCHWFSQSAPDWDDGSVAGSVIIPANGTWTHTYSSPGTYDICITVFEGDPNTDFCWNKEMCTTVTVECDQPCIEPATECLEVTNTEIGEFNCDMTDCNEDPFCQSWFRNRIQDIINNGCGFPSNNHSFTKATWNGITVIHENITGVPDLDSDIIYNCQGTILHSCQATGGGGQVCSPDAGLNVGTDLMNVVSIWNCGDPLPPLDPTCASGSNCVEYFITIENTTSPSQQADQVILSAITSNITLSQTVFNITAINSGESTVVQVNICGNISSGDILKIDAQLNNVNNPDGWCCEESATICLEVPPCPAVCCYEDPDDFTAIIAGAISVSIEECKVIVNLATLPDCAAITSIDWGNGSVVPTPITTPGMYMNTYTSGVFTISIGATAYDTNGAICIEQSSTYTILLECCDGAPIFDNCPPMDIILTADANCENDTDINLTASHPCADVTVTITCVRSDGAPINAPWPLGTTTVTCTATDSNGQSTTCLYTVIVQDLEPPMIDCPADLVLSAAGGTGTNVIFLPPTATDNCGIQSLSCDVESGDFLDCGVHTITCTAIDFGGNVSTCTFQITVNCDPTPCCYTDQNDFITNITGAINVSTDECKGIVNLATLPDCAAITSIDWGNGSVTPAPIATPGMYMENYTTGSYTITISAEAYDTNGIICFEQTFTYDIDIDCCDGTPIFDNCPATDIILTADANCENDTDINLTASHPCAGVTVTITCVRSDGAPINAPWPLGTTTVTCTATDNNGQSTTCLYTVIVQDLEPPMIDCPADLTLSVTGGGTGTNALFFPPTATDNCGVQSLSCDVEFGDFLTCGVHTITCTAVDFSGNIEVCTFEITVICDPCSFLDVSSTEMEDCCFEIDLVNDFDQLNRTIRNVNLELITPGVIFDIGTLGPGLNFSCAPTGQLICITDNVTGSLPNGNINDAIDFCFTNITNTTQIPQEVVVSWYENVLGILDSVLVCQDTLIFDCPIELDNDGPCWTVDSLSVDCSPLDNTHYDFTFEVFNNSAFTAQNVTLYNLSTGFNFDDQGTNVSIISVNLPTSIPPNGSGIATVTIVTPTALISPVGVCFDATLSGVLPNGQWQCCSDVEQICITLEPCCDVCDESEAILTSDPDEDCCHEVTIVNECNRAQFTKVEIAILTPGVIFGSHFTGGTNPADWSNPLSTPNRIQWEYDPTGIIPLGTNTGLMNFCLDEITDASQYPQLVEVRWIELGATGEMITCRDTLTTYCDPVIDYSCTTLKAADFDCQDDGSFDFVFSIQNTAYPVHPADFLDIQIVSPVGASIAPNGLVFSPALQPDSCATGVVNLTGVNSGDNLIVIMRLRDLLTGDSWCCYEGDTLNLVIPECCIDPCEEVDIIANGGTDEECCISLDVISECAGTIYQRLETEVITSGITFTGQNTGSHTDWTATTISPTEIHWTPNVGVINSGTMDSLLNFCLDNPAFDTVQTVEIRWIDNNGNISCTEIKEFSCPVSSCHEDQLIIPQGFTPNSDGFNPIFEIPNLNRFCNEVDLVVYNRWGNIVYQENNFDNNWNGDSNNGQPLPDGTYYLVIELKDSKEQFARFIDIRR